MREMKDSGVEWIGEVPRTWRVERFKGLAINVTEPIPQGSSLSVPLENVEPWTGKLIDAATSEDSEGCAKGFCRGDVLFSKLRPYLAKVFCAPCAGACSGEMLVLRPRGIDSKFLSYYLMSPSTVDEINGLNFGAKMPRADWNIVCNLRVPLPPIKEQRRIVSFLDGRCAVIDNDIDKRREVIEKLKEYKKSLIAHAVTKGLDPNTEMKDGGVEWIGEVPLDWKVLYPKALFCLRNERMRPGDIQLAASQEYGMISQSEFQRLEGRRVVQVILNPEILKHVEPGDFVMHMRSFQGGLEISGRAGCISSAYVMLHKRTDQVVNDFYKYLFKSSVYIDALRSTSNLIRDGQALRFANFIQVYLPLPPTETQEKIASFLDERCTKIDKAISRQKQLIEKLGEYRKSIIHHAITGKIDCTEA